MDQPLTPAAKPSPGRATTFVSGLAVMTLAVLAGCSPPRYQGPQIQDPPPGFFLKPEATKDRELFPDREAIHRDAWVNAQWGEISTIHITGYRGTLMRADVRSALEEAKAAATEPVTFGELQEVRIDGRTAWGWDERLQTPETGLEWVAYRVVVPYDTISYAVELYSGDPTFKGVPDTLAAIASTFGVGETRWNIPLLVVIGVLLVVLVSAARSRSQAQKERMRNIHFVEIPKKEGEGGEADPAAAKTPGGGRQAPGGAAKGGGQAPGGAPGGGKQAPGGAGSGGKQAPGGSGGGGRQAPAPSEPKAPPPKEPPGSS